MLVCVSDVLLANLTNDERSLTLELNYAAVCRAFAFQLLLKRSWCHRVLFERLAKSLYLVLQ